MFGEKGPLTPGPSLPGPSLPKRVRGEWIEEDSLAWAGRRRTQLGAAYGAGGTPAYPVRDGGGWCRRESGVPS